VRVVQLAVAAALVGAGLAVQASAADAAPMTLRIGALLPKTGNLAILGPPAIDGTNLEVANINAAGGVFGQLVQLEVADSGDARTDLAQRSVTQRDLKKQGLLPQRKVRVYLVDGNIAEYTQLAKGLLNGVRGTIPGAKPSTAFQAWLRAFDPKLADYSYAAEAYDATVLNALAAAAANSGQGSAIAAKMADVSKGGTVCRTFAACVALLKQGKDIDYDGQSGRVEFDSLGDVRQAEMGVYEYGKKNTYHPLKFVSGAVPAAPK
jgi:ABC-type branched-subunit amino acid transport system substrate-binding protein